VTLQTVAGHPLAGAVRFSFEEQPGGDSLRFQVEVLDRAASAFDWLAMAALGSRMQRANWREIVETLVEESGGAAPAGVQEQDDTLEGDEAERVESWLRELALARKRATHATESSVAPESSRDPASAP
jgi:NADH dehydrogenase